MVPEGKQRIYAILFTLFLSLSASAQHLYINIINGDIFRIEADYSLTWMCKIQDYNYVIGDIAISPSQRMYGVGGFDIIEINYVTGDVTLLHPLPLGDSFVTLVCDNQDNLYLLSALQHLYKYEIANDSLIWIADLSHNSPGDLTFYRGNILFQSALDYHIKSYNLETGLLHTVLCQQHPLPNGNGLWGLSTVFTSCEEASLYATDNQDNFYELDIENNKIYLIKNFENFNFPAGTDIDGMASDNEHLGSECVHYFEDVSCTTAQYDEQVRKTFLYPNPADQVLYVLNSTSNSQPESILRIFDMQGRMQLEYVGEQHSGLPLDVSILPPGIYCVQYAAGSSIQIAMLMIQ